MTKMARPHVPYNEATGKAAVIETLFGFLYTGKISAGDAAAQIKAIFAEIGEDYTTLLDGVVEGGLCFNRELYKQKLELDQHENVTYETDITENQLRTMMMYLGGNLNKFSILKNNCATGAIDIWNAALADRPELHIEADLTGIVQEPQSLYFKLGQMALDESLGGKGGTNFYPRTVAYKTAEPEPAPAKATLTTSAVKRADGVILVTSATTEDLRGKSVNIGVYDENGVLLKVKTVAHDNITDTQATAAISDNTAASYIKVFVWDSITSLMPIGGTEVVGLN